MLELLVVISLLLHGFTFLWIMILLQRIRHVQSQPDRMNQLQSELEDILVAYTTEMKEENERLLEKIQRNNHQATMSLEEKQLTKASNDSIKLEEKEEEDSPYIPPINISEQETYEKSYTVKVLELAQSGLTSEQIAKKLKMGKGEVELILKFHQS
ncbi:DUF6115 domain-containing protein [Halalkalibacter hemicellulosilyticus]|uniref:Swarming motility protein SwrB n=1 Tax=Halalkalibacter hemicellulosilyticusJCM 9152 TaxID=1236971 RepID=W4QBC6_9BACI|nr:hypothetical protein [Halalkalibacter hemicellulosilyticus]GAE29272.1 hypothetical protein JCM9152_619 [Halalkalibacter hemicellulosilyticusJCM 9152]